MHGDVCPLEAVNDLCHRYPQLRVYIDDAHGMSMTGTRGQGFALTHVRPSKQIHCVTSFAKGFGGSGAALLVGDDALAQQISMFAGPFLFSGPLHPPMIGANIESGKIHLTDEISAYQEQLSQRLEFFDNALQTRGVRVECRSLAPFRYVRVPGESGSYTMAAYLRRQGYLVPPVVFPVVPATHCGIRMSVTRLHSETQLDGLAHVVAERLRINHE